MGKSDWYKKSYRRILVDMHIEDWYLDFHSKFDSARYMENLKKANVQAAVVFTNSHVGCCYWPTKVGKAHQGLKDRDFTGELIERCHREGINVILYYSLLYDNRAYRDNPSWRLINVQGRHTRDKDSSIGRYGICCPNIEGYRKFTRAQLRELCENYNFESFFFDMTFWPQVCYCDSCRKRFAEEVGGEIPEVIDWENVKWISFQKKREEWIAEFSQMVYATIKKYKPEATAEFQFSPATHNWIFGVTEDISYAGDFAGGDFYGGFLQQSFVCKLYYSTTNKMPFEYMTSCSPKLSEHTATKDMDALRIHAAITMAHNGAMMFVDAIDPAGTQNPRIYESIGSIYEKTRLYEPFLGGELQSDVGIYFSLESKMDLADNGKKPASFTRMDFINNVMEQNNLSNKEPHLDAALGTARTLIENHIPYGVFTKSRIKDLSRYKVVVVPNILMMGEEEAQVLKDYVINGGNIYVSGFRVPSTLSEIFGVTFEGVTEECYTYISPTQGGKYIMPGVLEQYPLAIHGPQVKAKAHNINEVMGDMVLPYTNPSDTTVFASIHSNPPGKRTENAAIVYRKYGKGNVVWVSAPLEMEDNGPHKKAFMQIIRTLREGWFTFEAEAHPAVEMTVFHQENKKRYIISLVNQQEKFPVIPLGEIRIYSDIKGMKALRALLLPDGSPLMLGMEEGRSVITVPGMDVFCMIALEYE